MDIPPVQLWLVWLAGLLGLVATEDFRVAYEVVEEQASGTVIGNLFTDSGLSSHYAPSILSQLHFEFMPQSADYEPLFSIDHNALLTTSGLVSIVLYDQCWHPCHPPCILPLRYS